MPFSTLIDKFCHSRFEPSGFTKNPDIRTASSIVDYVFRWLGCQFIPGFREATNPSASQQELPMKELEEAIKKKVNRPVPELPRVDDVPEPAQAASLPHTSGNGKSHVKSLSDSVSHFMKDAPTCPNCGHIVVRNGACFKCINCGESLGCS